jgi:sedoheptulose-bisphosphatase
MQATTDNDQYRNLVQHYIGNRYTLRYSGALVPDVFHILAKGSGVYTTVASPSAKCKLRLL